MTQSVISKSIDIYHYPKKFEGNLGSVTLGDLHGNSVKLLHFLLRHDVVKFKDSVVNPAESYDQFVVLYTKMSIIVDKIIAITPRVNSATSAIKRYDQQINLYEALLKKGKNRTQEEEEKFQEINIDKLRTWRAEQSTKLQDAEEIMNQAKADLKKLDVVNQCNRLVKKLEVKDKDVLVRLIGDELADRGPCDYFTLKILEFLGENNVNVDITVSNHSFEFIAAYENLFNAKNNELKGPGSIQVDEASSFMGLKILLNEKLVTTKEISKIINQSYKPCLKLIDYTLNETGINIFTHAPAVFDIIKNTADYFEIAYDDSTKESLAQTIDKINTRFSQIVAENKVSEWMADNQTVTESIVDIKNMDSSKRAKFPLDYLIWNRWNAGKELPEARPAQRNGYDITYTHGHDNFQSLLPQITNLDTECGKSIPREILTAIESGKNSIPESPENFELYKALNSNEKNLPTVNSPKDPDKINRSVDFENKTDKKSSPSPENKFTPDRPLIALLATVGLIIGAAIGIALVASGVFAPLGAGILGALGLGLATGGGLSLILGAVGLASSKNSDNPLNNQPFQEVTLEPNGPPGCSVSLIGKKLNEGNDREIELKEVKSQSNEVIIGSENNSSQPAVSHKEQLSLLRKNHTEVNNHEEHDLRIKTNP
ncbi:MAG TPA: type IV secretion protein Dot [Legionella sp.]|nr:type IV secretion protein Dot [Legionella sp.]